MNEEAEEIKVSGDTESENAAPDKPSKFGGKPMYIALAIIGVVVVGVLLIWFLRGGEGGQNVPAPRTVSFGPGGDQPSPEAGGEQTVTLQPEQVESLGLKIETVGETLSGEAMTMATTGVVQPNAYNETPVISLVGGVIRKVDAVLGENVPKGSSVAVIFSDELASAQSRYLALQTEAQTARQNYERAAQLVHISPASNAELDDALKKLKTAQAELEEHHRHHERTTKLLEIGAASREEFEQATTKLKTAEADVEEARKRYDRAVKVAEINPISRSDFEQAAVKLRTAETDLSSARQRLILLGFSSQRVASLRSPSQISSELTVTAPVSGTVTARSVNQGEVVEANKELLKVTNLSTVWVIAQVYEKEVARLRIGSGANVTTDSYPGRLFRGHVSYIDPNINQQTRTVQVRVELENPGQIFKVGMYVNVAFGSMGAAEKTMPVVPISAVQSVNNKKVVFVATDRPNVFVMKPVRLGPETDGQHPVLEGINVGDRIVTEGSFLLRAEWLKQNPAQQ